MTHGSLFSGIGGFDLAAEWMGWENIFHCEWNPFGQKVLKHYWPNAISYENICTTDFTVHRGKVDIITGGFPCQPYSLAGKRLGKEDERHLWPEMLRTIREVQPRWVVGENVFGLVNWSGGLVFHEVQADLEAQGYEVQPYILPAVSVNAPHRRDRVWFVAHSKNFNADRCTRDNSNRQQIDKAEWEGVRSEFGNFSIETFTSDANGFIRKCSEREPNSRNEQSKKWKKSTRITSTRFSISQNASDTNSERLQGGQKINRWKEFNSEWAGDGDDLRTVSKNNSRYSKCNFENFPTISPVCNGDDGLSERLDAITFPKWRAESVKAGGNAIVPQVAYQIFKTIQAYERSRIAKEDR
jgi:DNA (cytosine-5)-methyltransferase 1